MYSEEYSIPLPVVVKPKFAAVHSVRPCGLRPNHSLVLVDWYWHGAKCVLSIDITLNLQDASDTPFWIAHARYRLMGS